MDSARYETKPGVRNPRGFWNEHIGTLSQIFDRHGGAFGLLLSLAVAASFRLYTLGDGHPGLAIYTSISRNAYQSFHGWLYPSMLADGSILADKPPLFFWINGVFVAILGPTDLAFRLPCALAGIVSVGLLYLIVRRCHGTQAAIVAGLALAVMPLDVNYSRSTFIEPVTVAFMLGATYAVIRAVQEKREGFFYIAAAVLGMAFMVKLWQGLLPAPAFVALAFTQRWTPWPRFIRVGAISAGIFLITAFWWPALVWLTSSAYDSVMHADDVWDMIFGWNLRERFGALEYGANHRRDFLWFVTGPLSLFWGISLFPAAAIGAIVSVWRMLNLSDTSAAGRRTLRKYLPRFGCESANMSILWLVWMAVALAAYGGASVRLATYWTSATPAAAALAGIGIAGMAGYIRRGGFIGWTLTAVTLLGIGYCASVYGSVSHVGGYFGNASALGWTLFIAIGVAAAIELFGWRPFRGRLTAWITVGASLCALLLMAVVSIHNISSPRDDTLGRIGFDMVDIPGPPPPQPTSAEEERKQIQGSLITSIARTEPEHMDAAMRYVQSRSGDSRYLLAADTFNTAARITLITGEAVLPLYSEYEMKRVADIDRVREMMDNGELRFALMSSHMLRMDFDLFVRMRSGAWDVTARSGLPRNSEMRLFEMVNR